MSKFTVICKSCGSSNVALGCYMDVPYIVCNDCNNKAYEDDLAPEKTV